MTDPVFGEQEFLPDMAQILPLPFSPSVQVIEQALACIQTGGVLALPTDSYYALAVGAFHSIGLKRLQALKADRVHKPFPVLVGDPIQLENLVEDIPEIAQKLIQQFWPGLLTLVLKAKPEMSLAVTGESGYIGIRQPNDPRVCKVLNQTGPLTGTSANRSGQLPAKLAEEVSQQVGSQVDLILDGGTTPGGQPSTVLEIEPELRILRQGAISLSDIQLGLGKMVRGT